MREPSEISHKNIDSLNQVADILFAYLHDVIYNPSNASLEIESLPESFADVGNILQYLNNVISETRSLAKELAAGNLNCKLPPPSNELAAPLKALHASLKHLTWQTQLIAKGYYNQRVDFMGAFSEAFNHMIMQLEQRWADNLSEKSRLKDFLAKMSHEIRTPMNAIIGMTELALREEKLEAAREHLFTVKQAGFNLLSLINDILDFSKIEQGKLEIIQANYLFSSLIHDVISIIRMRAIDSQIRFTVNIDSNIPNALIGDEIRIRQVLINILGNAIKYTQDGFVSFALKQEILEKILCNYQ